MLLNVITNETGAPPPPLPPSPFHSSSSHVCYSCLVERNEIYVELDRGMKVLSCLFPFSPSNFKANFLVKERRRDRRELKEEDVEFYSDPSEKGKRTRIK